jgi:hypothetical protein
MKPSIRAVCLVVSLASLAASAHAGDIINTFGPGGTFKDAGYVVSGPSAASSSADVDQAAQFTTGGFYYSGIAIALGIYVDDPNNSPFDGRGPVKISINSNTASNLPGSILASATVDADQYKQMTIGATFGSLTLDPNTKYWLVMDGQGAYDGAFEWNDQGITAAAGETAGRSGGGAWSGHSSGDQFAFRVTSRTQVVPEPTTLAALGLGAVTVLRRRKKA